MGREYYSMCVLGFFLIVTSTETEFAVSVDRYEGGKFGPDRAISCGISCVYISANTKRGNFVDSCIIACIPSSKAAPPLRLLDYLSQMGFVVDYPPDF